MVLKKILIAVSVLLLALFFFRGASSPDVNASAEDMEKHYRDFSVFEEQAGFTPASLWAFRYYEELDMAVGERLENGEGPGKKYEIDGAKIDAEDPDDVRFRFSGFTFEPYYTDMTNTVWGEMRVKTGSNERAEISYDLKVGIGEDVFSLKGSLSLNLQDGLDANGKVEVSGTEYDYGKMLSSV